jgi:hypothetical protein
MSVTLPRPTSAELHPSVAFAPTAETARHGGRPRWPIFGVIGGLAGVASGATSITSVTDEQARSGVDVIDHLSRGQYHVSFMLGLVSVVSLFLAASGWKRWAEQRAPRDLAARTIGPALAAVATINIIFASIAGSMALYLPGGTDTGTLSREGIFVNYILLDFGMLLGWWGAIVAAGCVAALSFRRDRVLPRWMGVVSVLFMLPGIAMASLIALPGFVGLTMPIWLIVISIGLVFSRTAKA